ncbi:hypothetical protein ANO14919_039460 [Xylariales sp. No.14919]|nr:hypothetical protein ANO14919_039460 [Xylariales sp. No.14919]
MKATALLVVGAALATAQDYTFHWPKVSSGIACLSHHLTISYAQGFVSTTTVPPPPPATTVPWAAPEPMSTTSHTRILGFLLPRATPAPALAPADIEPRDHRHFTCTAIWRAEKWRTSLGVPRWLPESAIVIGTLNTYVTFTYLSSTSTDYYISGSFLKPPNIPSHTGLQPPAWPTPIPPSAPPAVVVVGGGGDKKSHEGDGLSAAPPPSSSSLFCPPATAECPAPSTAFVTVTVVDTVTETVTRNPLYYTLERHA